VSQCEGQTPVHGKDVAGDVGRGGGGQEDRGARRIAPATHVGSGGDPFAEFWIVVLGLICAGGEEAGGDDVDGDTLRGESSSVGEIDQTAFLTAQVSPPPCPGSCVSMAYGS
jgi:hypothetical protein